jgi:Arc/MetJ-type ribon-helix-helix transcriptional regulator
MTVTLTPDLEKIVNEQLATGQFANPEEVIAVSLQFLRRQYEELKAGIAESAAQADRRELVPFNPSAILAEARAARTHKTAGDAA